jgi:hypothetical protein
MAAADSLDENESRFLIELYEQTEGRTEAQVSMYTIGGALGMEKPAAGRVAESLMDRALIAFRTLAGGVAITPEGVQEALQLGAGPGEALALGSAPVLDAACRRAVDGLLACLRQIPHPSAAAIDPWPRELAADIRTVEAQLASPRPKTAIVRECLRSIHGALEGSDTAACREALRRLLGE